MLNTVALLNIYVETDSLMNRRLKNRIYLIINFIKLFSFDLKHFFLNLTDLRLTGSVNIKNMTSQILIQ